MSLPTHTTQVNPGIYAIDTGFERPRFDAAYLLVDDGHAAFIDTGHNAAVPRLLEALAAVGLPRNAVDWVIPTHVHLDHSGGVGQLMAALPSARALVHARGARHLIDPSALLAGAQAVYGADEVAKTYGDLLPVPTERVVTAPDGMHVTIGSRTLITLDTPGHARHHHCVWDATSRGWFTGDTFGIAYPEFRPASPTAAGSFIFPSSTPVQFDPDAMRTSIQRMLASEPVCIYPTHFSRQDHPAALARQLFAQLDAVEAGARAIKTHAPAHSEERLAALRGLVLQTMLDAARAAGSPLDDDTATELLSIDVGLNAQGLAVWLDAMPKA